MSDETQEFNIKRAYLIVIISWFTFDGIILYLQFSNIISFNAGVILLLTVGFAVTITGIGIRKYRDEQKERKKEIKQFRKW